MTFQQIADKLAISTATSTPLYFESFRKAVLDAALFDVQRLDVHRRNH